MIQRPPKNFNARPRMYDDDDDEAQDPQYSTNTFFEELLNKRIIMLSKPITAAVAEQVKSAILYLEDKDPESPIQIYIDSPGGSVYSGLGIIDVMQMVQCPIATINTGLAASMAAVILLCGDKGHRKAMPYSTTMLHQPLIGMYGYMQATEVRIADKEMQRIKDIFANIIFENTNMSKEQIQIELERDYWLSAEQAIGHGIVDGIVSPRKKRT